MAQIDEPTSEPTSGDQPPISLIAREMSESIKSVIRSEIHLAKAEIKENGSLAAKHSVKMAIFGIIAAFGVLPLLSFLVIGLGMLLNQNYWLSSLIVAVTLFIVGGTVAYLMFKRVKQVDLRFENTRDSVVTQLKTVDRKLHEVTEVAKTKASLHSPRRASS